MENEILEKFKEQDAKLDAILKSMERMRKFFIWKTVITVLFFLLPLVGLAFIIPWFISTLNSTYSELGL